MKNILILQASEDIQSAEIMNIASQIMMYDIKADIKSASNHADLRDVLYSGTQYDYIYLASHGCETHWGDISGTVNVKWTDFAALVCMSDVAKPGAIFLHSCCRGGLKQVAWQMFACCEKIEFVCGPRHDIRPVDLVIAFNLFLYNIEVKFMDPVQAAKKVLKATDIRLLCSDKIETSSASDYQNYCTINEHVFNDAFSQFDYPDINTLAITQPEKPADLKQIETPT